MSSPADQSPPPASELRSKMDASMTVLESKQDALAAALKEQDAAESAFAMQQIVCEQKRKLSQEARVERDAASAAMQTAIEAFRKAL